MAKVNAKLILSSLLSNFEFSLVDQKLYKEEVKFDPKSFPLKPLKNIVVKARRR